MDCWVEFFIAPYVESAAQVKGFGTRGAFESLPGGIYDPAVAVVEWESLLTGTGPQTLARQGESRVVTEITNDGGYVFVLSKRLVTSLAAADRRRLDEVARERARLRREDGEDITDEEAIAHVGELAGLARRAADQGSGLFCSVT
ncbi:MAG: hypothetical protein ACRDP6_18965 [Actinoallomurus sp.]